MLALPVSCKLQINQCWFGGDFSFSFFFHIPRKRIYSCMMKWLYVSTLATRGLLTTANIPGLVTEPWATDKQCEHPSSLVRNTEPSALSQPYWIRACIVRSQDDLYVQYSLRSIALGCGNKYVMFHIWSEIKKLENSEDFAIPFQA